MLSYLLLLSGIVARRCRAEADCITNDVTQLLLLNINVEDAVVTILRSHGCITSSLTVHVAHVIMKTFANYSRHYILRRVFFPTNFLRRLWTDFLETLPHDAASDAATEAVLSEFFKVPLKISGQKPRFG